MMRPVTERSLHGLGVERNDAWRPPDRARQICNPPYIARLSSTLAISGWVARGFGEAVEERAGDCRHVPGIRGR